MNPRRGGGRRAAGSGPVEPTHIPPPITAYVAGTAVLGAATCLWSWLSVPLNGDALSAFSFWFVLTLAAELFPVTLPKRVGMISMGLAANIAVLFVLPRPQAMTIAAAGVFVADAVLHRRGLMKAVFNASQTALAMLAASLVMSLLGMAAPLSAADLLLSRPLGLLAPVGVFTLVNTLLVTVVLALEQRRGMTGVWRENYGTVYQALSVLFHSAMGLGLLQGVELMGYVTGLASIPLLLIMRHAYGQFLRSRPEAPPRGVRPSPLS